MKKRFLLISCSIFLLLNLGSCGMSKYLKMIKAAGQETEEDTEELILTQRQKAILRQEGVSADVSKLSNYQKESIIAIEELLEYEEDKYEITFCYSGYIHPSDMEKEELTCYPQDGDPEEDSVVVTRDEDGNIEDTYGCLLAREPHGEKVEEVLANTLSEDTPYKYYDEICFASDDGTEDIGATLNIFVCNVPEDETEDCFEKIKSALYDMDDSIGFMGVYFVNQETFDSLTDGDLEQGVNNGTFYHCILH